MNCNTCKSRCVWAGQEASEHGKCLVGYTPTTHFDWIKSLSVEKLANVLTDDWCEILCGSPSICDGQCEGKMLSWLKTPLNKEGTT